MDTRFTRGEIQILRENVNSILGILLIGSFSLGMLAIFYKTIGQDPLSEMMLQHTELLNIDA